MARVQEIGITKVVVSNESTTISKLLDIADLRQHFYLGKIFAWRGIKAYNVCLR
jgi:hypothetical protein